LLANRATTSTTNDVASQAARDVSPPAPAASRPPDTCQLVAELAVCRNDTASGMRDGRAMTEDAVISVLSAATRIACRQMTPQYLDALHASVEQASGLPARPDWGRKATAHAELFNVLGDLAGDGDLAQVSSAAGRLHGLVLAVGPAADGMILSSRRRLLRQLRAWDADGAVREMEQHLKGLHYMGRLACGASFARITRAS